jgi:hypothetical protein
MADKPTVLSSDALSKTIGQIQNTTRNLDLRAVLRFQHSKRLPRRDAIVRTRPTGPVLPAFMIGMVIAR